MAMKLVKKTDEYSIYLRSDNRYAVRDANKNPVNGDDKVRILVAEDLIKAAMPAEPQPEAEESGAEDAPAEAEVSAEETPVEEVEEEAAEEEAPAEEEAAAEEAPAEEAPTEDEEDK